MTAELTHTVTLTCDFCAAKVAYRAEKTVGRVELLDTAIRVTGWRRVPLITQKGELAKLRDPKMRSGRLHKDACTDCFVAASKAVLAEYEAAQDLKYASLEAELNKLQRGEA